MPDEFSGSVRLFPLPDLVLFPHVVQPLKIFEPRYRAMLEDALEDDQLITMALIKSGWESSINPTAPPIHPAVCVGRVISHSELPDGTYNLLLAGISRARIVAEVPSERPFRTADVAVLDDELQQGGSQRVAKLRVDLIEAFRKLHVSDDPESPLQKLMSNEVPLGMLTDVIAYAAALPLPLKLKLLETTSVESRAAMLLNHLSAPDAESRPGRFPPDFSDN